MANLKRRVSKLEQRGSARQPSLCEFDDDALTIYSSMSYLDATLSPTYYDVEPLPIYARGSVLRDELYGPIIPAHLDEELKRYSRASGEFRMAFGREPKAGDVLRYEHVAWTHRAEVYARHFAKLTAAWKRQLPHLVCPLKFEDGRLFRRCRVARSKECAEQVIWEEDPAIQPDVRWFKIPVVLSNTDFESKTTIYAVMFQGIIDSKHRCRPATEEESQRNTGASIQDPSWFHFGYQRFSELLIEVFGA